MVAVLAVRAEQARKIWPNAMRGQLNYYAACEMSRETEAAVFERRDRLLCETRLAAELCEPRTHPAVGAVLRGDNAPGEGSMGFS